MGAFEDEKEHFSLKKLGIYEPAGTVNPIATPQLQKSGCASGTVAPEKEIDPHGLLCGAQVFSLFRLTGTDVIQLYDRLGVE
jgi:hypothetical protein